MLYETLGVAINPVFYRDTESEPLAHEKPGFFGLRVVRNRGFYQDTAFNLSALSTRNLEIPSRI